MYRPLSALVPHILGLSSGRNDKIQISHNLQLDWPVVPVCKQTLGSQMGRGATQAFGVDTE